MADTVYAFKPEQGRLSGGSFEKQVEYFLNHLRDSVTEEIEALTSLVSTLTDNYNNLSDRVTALQDTVNGYTARIATLEDNNTQNRTNIANLQSRVATLEETSASSTTRIGNLINSLSMLETTVSAHTTSINSLQGVVSELTTAVDDMEPVLEEASTNAMAGRHASVYVYGETEDATWYRVAETSGANTSTTMQLNLLAQPVGEQEGPAFTWVVEADADGVTSTGYADEVVPDGMEDNFAVTTWDEESETEGEVVAYTFQIQFQTAGSEGSNGWTDWATVTVPADELAWSLDATVGEEVTGLVADEVNVRVRAHEEAESVVEDTWDGTSLELTLDGGQVVTIATCEPDAEGTGLTVSGTYTPVATEPSYTRYYALWCRVPAGTDGRGWKFTVDAEATRGYLDSTIWSLYRLTDYGSGESTAGVDAIPATETAHATTFKNPVPDGLIALVNADTAPDGFAICDGNDDTPDLSGYVTAPMHFVQKV